FSFHFPLSLHDALPIFRDEFKIANIIGYTLLIIGYLLVMEMKILRGTGELIYLIASFGVTALFILYFIALLYIFPIFVHFNLKRSEEHTSELQSRFDLV